MRLYISNGWIVNPEDNTESFGDIFIEDGIIKEIKLYSENENTHESLYEKKYGKEKTHNQAKDSKKIEHIEAEGKWIVPGLIDLHVHFREPGFEYKEDIESGCRAAAKGGFTTVCVMPNTKPVTDCSEIVRLVDEKASGANGVNVLVIGAITKGQDGKILADYEAMINTVTKSTEMMNKGICGISEDGKTVEDINLMRQAMKKAKEYGLTVFSHAEPEAEIVMRDLKLAEETGCKLHFCHISEKESIYYIGEAKKKGIIVTAETAPHYFSLTKNDVNENPDKKMNPPLAGEDDLEKVKIGLKDNTLDAIATDHAPHHKNEKKLPFDEAPNGIIGLETSFAVSYTNLVKTGVLSNLELIRKMSLKPAEILGIQRGGLSVGKVADIAIIDVKKEHVIKEEEFESKAQNSPFIGTRVFGEIDYTIVNGKVIWRNEND